MDTRRTRVTRLLVAAVLAMLALAGCGGSDFENAPRPPVTLDITGVITNDRVTVSPDEFGAGPIILTISNQTQESHTIALEGEEVPTEEVGPINPRDTATLQKTLPEGTYEVSANSSANSVFEEIEPATLEVGAMRETGSDDLELP